ncbi:MAG: hypothetical protein JNJ60_15905 [Rhodocyclaceae bacterium]|nr:hypothetical protein [Rhodocyclaceae bacterium]
MALDAGWGLQGQECRSYEEGMLVADVQGYIWYTSQSIARLANRRVEEFLCMPISKCLPEVCLRAETPGYNLAWAILNFNGGRSLLTLFESDNGPPYAVQVQVSPTRLGTGNWFVVHLRIPMPE